MEMDDRQQVNQCGETYAALLDGFDKRPQFDNGVTYIAGFLSDAQEMANLAAGPELDAQTRAARLRALCQILNAAKYLMFARLDGLVPPAEAAIAPAGWRQVEGGTWVDDGDEDEPKDHHYAGLDMADQMRQP